MKLIRLIFFATATLFLGCVQQSDHPELITSEGRAIATKNCENSAGSDQVTCHGYFCAIALYQQHILPAYALSQHSRHLHNFSDQPGRSVHLAKYEYSGKTTYTRCDMDGDTIKAAYQISEQDYEQAMP